MKKSYATQLKRIKGKLREMMRIGALFNRTQKLPLILKRS